MSLSKLERLIVSAQVIKLHERELNIRDLDLIDDFEILKHHDETHIEYSIARVVCRNISEIYVIFPGSNDLDDWLANFRFRLQDMIFKPAKSVDSNRYRSQTVTSQDIVRDIGFVIPHADKPGSEEWSDQRVHGGFMAAYQLIEEQAMADMRAVLNDYPAVRVYGAGHSLGSAMLRFMMLDAQFKGMFEFRDPPRLTTFGAPRMGNQKFCNALKERLPHITRVVHSNDLVVRLPLPLMGYRHEVPEYFIGNKSYLRWYYKQDIKDHFLESYMSMMSHLRGVVAQSAKIPPQDQEQDFVTS